MNYCINAAWHEDDQSVALLRCNEAQVLQLICIVGSGVSHLDSLWGSDQASLLVNQAQ